MRNQSQILSLPPRRLVFVVFALPLWLWATIALSSLPAYGQGPALGDLEIQSAVLQLFEDDPLLDPTAIGVEVEQGVATLQGLARDLRDRDRAQRLASRVRGVRSIINSISVPALNIPDDAVAKDVRDALNSEPVTQDLNILVDVTGGEVAMRGRVESLVERKALYVIASAVRGVQGVDIANIDIVPLSGRPAKELKREIEARWAWNVWTADADLSVAVDNGVAMISGAVPSLWVRDVAADLAALPGIKSVDSTAVTFLAADADPMVRDRPPALTDSDIRTAIDKALFLDFEVFSANIEISVRDGVATLAGTVPTLAQREKAATIAGDTVGVRAVRNDMAVRVPEAPSDERLVQLVKDRLARAPRFADTAPIGVTAQAGIVTLFGTVGDLFDKRRAEALAKQQFGVTGVVNTLQVSG